MTSRSDSSIVTSPGDPRRSVVGTPVIQDFTQWQHLITQSFVPVAVRTEHPDRFWGRLRSRVLNDVSIVEVTAAGQTVMRTPRLISESDRMYFKLSLQISGTGLLIQNRREAVLSPGDAAVYDTHRPYPLAFEGDFRSMVLMFPHDLIKLPVHMVGQLSAVRLAGNSGLGRMVSPFLLHLTENLDQLSGASGLRMAYHALDLVTTMFAAELDLVPERTDNPRWTLLKQVLDFIEVNLRDPRLSPGFIAVGNFISTRHLHNLFRSEGTTVTHWIRTRRLECCRRDLLDPALRQHTVSAIAFRWGFIDAAHFSRSFRAAFGESPSSFRNHGAINRF